MVTRDIVSRPCEDACATVKTARTVEGAPVYRCPGCDSEWIELDERPAPAGSGPSAAPDAVGAGPGRPDAPGAGTAPDVPAVGPAGAMAPAAGMVAPAPGVVHPRLLQTVLDARDIRPLAEFYRALLGLIYAPGDAPHFSGSDEPEWLVLTHHDGTGALAFQADDKHIPPTWPASGVPQQLHLDLTVADRAELENVRLRAETLGARVLLDRTADAREPLYVFADPAGHPFCVFVA